MLSVPNGNSFQPGAGGGCLHFEMIVHRASTQSRVALLRVTCPGDFCRFVSLSMLALVMRACFFLVLLYLWGSRCFIVWMAALKSGGHVGCDTAQKALGDSRFRVRLVAMPFLDSVMDGTVAFASGLTLTLVEFIACLVIYRLYRHDDLTSRVWLVLTLVAVSCMVGKMCLALVAIFPLKKNRDGSEDEGDAFGEGGGGAPVGVG